MEDSSKKFESKNAKTSPPPYKGEMQELKLTVSSYPTAVEGLGNNVPSHSEGVVEMQPIRTVYTQTAITIPTRPDPPIDSFLGRSIFVLIFCFLPFGVVALVFACKSRSKEAVRDFKGARQASTQAKYWSFAGLFTGLTIMILSGIILWIIL